MTKDEFVDRRTKIISKMLGNPDRYGIYPTTEAFAEFDDLFDDLMNYERGPSWAQIDRNSKKEKGQCETPAPEKTLGNVLED